MIYEIKHDYFWLFSDTNAPWEKNYNLAFI